MPKRILFICHRIPYPPNKGDKIRSFNFIRHLAARHQVHLAFMVDNKDDLKNIEPLKKFAKNIFYDTLSPRVKKITSAMQALLLTSQPVSIPYFYSKKLQHKIDAFLDGNTIDSVFCFSSPTAEYLFNSRHYKGQLQKMPWVMDLIDVDSHKWRQYAETNRQALRWLYRREADYLLQYEKRIVKEFQQILLVSESEKKLLHKYVSAPNIKALGNGVDLEYFAPDKGTSTAHDAPTLVFTGAMDYWPNIEGVEWFADAVFPLIKQAVPDVRLHIVGSNPTPQVKDLAKIDGIFVVGYVTDIRDYFAAADIAVIPLRIARGIQNKVLEAMAMGKAVVCTAEALEGITAEPGKDLLVAGAPEAFAKAVIMLLENQPYRQQLGDMARSCMEKNYSWAKALEHIDDTLFQSDGTQQEIK
jgi:polysaccharide biosynthesis protein PslH